MDIKINGNGMPNMPGDAQVAEMAQNAGVDAQKILEAAQVIASLLGGANVQVSQTNGVEGRTGANPTTSAPELDEADLEKAGKADLEAVVAYLQMKMDEEMAKVQGERLESLKGQLQSAHDTQMEKIENSIKEAQKQEKAAKAQKAFGWLSAIVAVVVAVVVTVTTGGLAAGFAIAGAALAVSSAVMNETGATKAICKAISNSLQEHQGLSKTKADAAAQGIFAACELVLGLACGIGGGVASARMAAKAAADGAKLLSAAAKAAKIVISVSTGVIQAGGLATAAASTAIGYQAGKAQADATENQAYLTKIQKMLEECEEDLEAILDQLMSAGADMLALLESQTDTANKITQEIGLQNA